MQPLAQALHIGSFLGGGGNFVATWAWVTVAAFIAFALLPLRWKPTTNWAISIGLLGAAGLLSLTRPSEFLYFQF